MTAFQFDECSTCKSFIRGCKKEGHAEARKYPTRHKGLDDPEMLSIYMYGDGVLVTFDLAIVDEHGDHIPNENPGLVMVGHSPAIPYTLTQQSAAKIIGKFKDSFPDWHLVSWANSIVKLTDASIEVGRKSSTGFAYRIFEFDVAGWQDALKICLLSNSASRAQ